MSKFKVGDWVVYDYDMKTYEVTSIVRTASGWEYTIFSYGGPKSPNYGPSFVVLESSLMAGQDPRLAGATNFAKYSVGDHVTLGSNTAEGWEIMSIDYGLTPPRYSARPLSSAFSTINVHESFITGYYKNSTTPVAATNANCNPPDKTNCNHQWSMYTGLRESFEHCGKCGVKKSEAMAHINFDMLDLPEHMDLRINNTWKP